MELRLLDCTEKAGAIHSQPWHLKSVNQPFYRRVLVGPCAMSQACACRSPLLHLLILFGPTILRYRLAGLGWQVSGLRLHVLQDLAIFL
jgi:hypothetical protein